MLKTCKTFDTTDEAAAFMMGFRVGRKKTNSAEIDQEELETVLIDCGTDNAEGVYLDAVAHYTEEMVEGRKSLIDAQIDEPPAGLRGMDLVNWQYEHDCNLPNYGE